ncbi:MAG: DUF6875 domain-containing protein [Chloroflexia bacterium]
MRVSSTDPTLYLLEPHHVERDLLPSYIKVYETQVTAIIDWAHTYLCHSHVELGRDGPVCPYTQPSLDQELFWLTVHPGHNPTLEEVCVIVMKYREWFLELEPATIVHRSVARQRLALILHCLPACGTGIALKVPRPMLSTLMYAKLCSSRRISHG